MLVNEIFEIYLLSLLGSTQGLSRIVDGSAGTKPRKFVILGSTVVKERCERSVRTDHSTTQTAGSLSIFSSSQRRW